MKKKTPNVPSHGHGLSAIDWAKLNFSRGGRVVHVRRKCAQNFRGGHFRISCRIARKRRAQKRASNTVGPVHWKSSQRVTDGGDRSMSRVDIVLDIITKSRRTRV